MENENIMENNEVMEVAENIANSNSGLGWKIIGGVLITAGVIYGGIKLRKKIKTKKEEEYAECEVNEDCIVDDEDVE